jgi:BA14K-like protein
MIKGTLKATAAAAMIGLAAFTLPSAAHADRWHGHGGWGWGAGLVGFGVGALVGTALAPREVYVEPDDYYEPVAGPVGYGPPPWSPEWYTYCKQRYRSFNAHTGYFTGYDGQPYFCQ